VFQSIELQPRPAAVVWGLNHRRSVGWLGSFLRTCFLFLSLNFLLDSRSKTVSCDLLDYFVKGNLIGIIFDKQDIEINIRFNFSFPFVFDRLHCVKL
jgi:hypothetical protein